MTGPTATCELWLDGVRVPDTGTDLVTGKATALDGLTLTWGRDGPNEQPGPATLVVDVLDLSAAADWLTTLHVGSDVQLWSEAHLTSEAAGWGANIMDPGQASFTGWADGAPPTLALYQLDNATVTVTAAQLLLTPGTAGKGGTIVPPRPFSPPGELPNAWDDIPRASLGERWRLSVRAKLPPGAKVRLVWGKSTAPYQGSLTTTTSNTVTTGTGDWQTITEDVGGGDSQGNSVWLIPGLTYATDVKVGRRWQDQTGTWAADTRKWNDASLSTTMLLDDFAVLPPAATTRRVLSFSGAVSDVKAVPEAGGLLYTVTAADLAAQLGNTVVGDNPWPQQTLGVRADRVAQLAGITASPRIRVDTPLQALQVSARDVDAQPAYALLQDLATTGGGVLWAATHAVTGPFLWIENPDRRTAVAELTLSGGIIVIVGSITDTTTVSACDVLQDGVMWLQDTQDVATVVAVTWAEQGPPGDDGLPTVTDRTVTWSAGPTDLAKYGTRRLSITTELVNATDATNYATRALALARGVGWRVEGITLDTGMMPATVDTVDDSTRQVGLCNMLDGTTRMGLALTLVDMPAYAPRGSVSGYYLEGGRYSYTGGRWRLELIAAPSAGQGSSATWTQLDPTWKWNQWAPTVRWVDLAGVAA